MGQSKLTPREMEVVSIACNGYSTSEIADGLGISINTVKTLLKRIYTKLEISSRAELALFSKDYFFDRSSIYDFRIQLAHVCITIHDQSGAFATYKKTLQISAIKEELNTFIDSVYSDGEVRDIVVEPGIISKIQSERGNSVITTKLEKSLAIGDEITRSVLCDLNDAFIKKDEYWIQDQSYPANEVIIEIVFPENRKPEGFEGVHRIGYYELKDINKPKWKNNRIIWNIANPTIKDSYKLMWTW